MNDPSPIARIRPMAAADMEEIVRYLDAQSDTAADRFHKTFFDASQTLAEMPRLGSVRRTRGRLKGLRSWPLTEFGPYLIFYFPLEKSIEALRVEVLHVLHGARNVDRELRK